MGQVFVPPSTDPGDRMSPRPGRFQSQLMTTTIHLSGPADVLTVLPYQLGFHPHECLVVVTEVQDRKASIAWATRTPMLKTIKVPMTVDSIENSCAVLLK